MSLSVPHALLAKATACLLWTCFLPLPPFSPQILALLKGQFPPGKQHSPPALHAERAQWPALQAGEKHPGRLGGRGRVGDAAPARAQADSAGLERVLSGEAQLVRCVTSRVVHQAFQITWPCRQGFRPLGRAGREGLSGPQRSSGQSGCARPRAPPRPATPRSAASPPHSGSPCQQPNRFGKCLFSCPP